MPRESISAGSPETTIHVWLPEKAASEVRELFKATKERGLIGPDKVLGQFWSMILRAYIRQITPKGARKAVLKWSDYPPVDYDRAKTTQSNMRLDPSEHAWLLENCTEKKSVAGVSKNRFVHAAVSWFLALPQDEQAAKLKLDAMPKVDPDTIKLKVAVSITPPAARAILRALRWQAPDEADLATEVALALKAFDRV